MDFKAKLGEKFREDMTAEEVLEMLSSLDISELTDSEKVKKLISDANSEAAKWKKDFNALKQSLMSDEERRKMEQVAIEEEKRERDAREAEKDAFICRISMEKEFAAAGFSESEYTPYVENYSGTSLENAMNYVKHTAKLRKSDIEAIELKHKEESMAAMQKPNTGKTESNVQNLTLAEMMQRANVDPASETEILTNLQKKE